MLELNSSLTIYEVEAMQDQFLSLLGDDTIIIDCSALQKIDMSGLQLLVSLKKSAHEMGKDFTMLNISDEIQANFDLSGMGTILGV